MKTLFKFFYIGLCLLLAGNSHAIAQKNKNSLQPVELTIDAGKRAQTIANFGAAGCWFSEAIGKDWPQEKKERIAELLFSKEKDAIGNPKGIGLSAWRFNIGGGTAEQGDSSGIRSVHHRVACFLNPDGTYNWNKQPGYRWFLQKAKNYGVEDLIAFSNTPPVQFTQNGLGFKTTKDFKSNLRPDKYEAYADFLAEVLKHFRKEGIHFNYISPVNEPQWDWIGKFGEAKQEGTPWQNEEIYKVVRALNTALEQKQLQSHILTTEAATLKYMYGESGGASQQVQALYDAGSRFYIGNLKHVPKLVAGHSYFTDAGDSAIIATRKQVAGTVQQHGIAFWQSEYSMLGDGFREGAKGRRSAMDCGLFLAKIIHHDLTEGNAAAWQFWNAYEPGSAEFDTRYYLIALQPNPDFTDGNFAATKNLWALGHYSLFIRPGMHRLHLRRSDNPDVVKAAQKLLVSAYADGAGKTVVVAINYQAQEQQLKISSPDLRKAKTYSSYVTTAAPDDNLKAQPVQKLKAGIRLPPRSITTVVIQEAI